jgi:hypothetical protein
MIKKLKAEIEGRYGKVKFLWTKAFKVGGDTACAILVYRTKKRGHQSIRSAKWMIQYRVDVVTSDTGSRSIVLKTVWK